MAAAVPGFSLIGTSARLRVVAARRTSSRSDSSNDTMAWASGSPKRQLYSTSRGPSSVSMMPA